MLPPGNRSAWERTPVCAGPLPAAAPKLPLGPAVGDDAESVRWRLRERVSGPDGDDAGDELGDRALGGGG